MKRVKSLISIILIFCFALSLAGCAEDDFKPTGITVVENINGIKYEYPIENEAAVKKLWDKIADIEYDEEEALGTKGSSYYYFYFYNADKDKRLIFTIYDNGSFCLDEEFDKLYVMSDGVQLYLDLEEMCKPYKKDAQVID